ncbi:MAG: hypothetical protein R2770_16730 [Acidimicrobiales bacterium]
MQTSATKWIGPTLIALGVLSAVAGIIGLVGHFASDDQDANAAVSTEPPDVVSTTTREPTTTSTGATSTSTSTTTTAAPTSTTSEPAEPLDPRATVQDFFANWAVAIGEADVEFLLAALHPAVIDRYGTEQCAAYLEQVAGQPIEVEVVSTSELITGEFARDGLTRVIDDLVLVEIARRDRGAEEAVVQQTRLGFVEGEPRWFTDCGEPLEEAP